MAEQEVEAVGQAGPLVLPLALRSERWGLGLEPLGAEDTSGTGACRDSKDEDGMVADTSAVPGRHDDTAESHLAGTEDREVAYNTGIDKAR